MTVRVLYFATFRQIAGRDEENLTLPEGATVATLWNKMNATLPSWGAVGAIPPAAVNCAYVPATHPLCDNDEVAFLPPVAGG